MTFSSSKHATFRASYVVHSDNMTFSSTKDSNIATLFYETCSPQPYLYQKSASRCLTRAYGRGGATPAASLVFVGLNVDVDLLMQLRLPVALLAFSVARRVFSPNNTMMRGRWASLT
jgi:hypothetical protein